MKKDNCYSSLLLISPHQGVVTPLIITKVLARIKKWSLMKQLKRTGIDIGINIRIDVAPYICYVSHCDKSINKDDFNGRICIGNNVTMWSCPENAFPNTTIRMTLVKSAPGKTGRIIIGDNVHLQGTSIVSYEKITIADNVLFGPLVSIMDCDGHALAGRGNAGEYDTIETKPVEIKENAWIGFGALILKGVSIGRNSIVGAYSVVHRSVPDNTVVAGNPARVIKQLQ